MQKRILALITLPLWLFGGFLTSSGIMQLNRLIFLPHYCDFPESGCSNWAFPFGLGLGIALLLGTTYAFVLNHKREVRKINRVNS